MIYKIKLIVTAILIVFCSLANAQEATFIESNLIYVNPESSPSKIVEPNTQSKTNSREKGAGKYSRILNDYIGNSSLASKNSGPNETSAKSNFVRSRDDGDIQVYLSLTSVDGDTIQRLQSLGVDVEVVNKQFKMVQGWISMSDLNELSSHAFITEIASPDYSYSNKGAATSQGVEQLKANGLAELGYRGKGVKVGIVSSGANDWRLARDSGDLPEQLTVYGSCTKRRSDASVTDLCSLFDASCNEGTAMAEIVHDIAPEAEIGIAAVGT